MSHYEQCKCQTDDTYWPSADCLSNLAESCFYVCLYVPKGYQVAMAISRSYHETRMKEGGDVVEHLNKLKELWERLSLFGDEDYKISDTQFKANIALSLPQSWDTFTEPYVGHRVGVKETDPKKLIHSQEFI